MTVRHLVARENVDRHGIVVDAARVRHGAVRAGRVYALAGEVDPATHLNLDFPDHRLEGVVVVEDLSPGAGVVASEDGFGLARVDRSAFAHRGRVDVGARRVAWLAALHAARRDRVPGPGPAAGHGVAPAVPPLGETP
jgi:hypothetical protein